MKIRTLALLLVAGTLLAQPPAGRAFGMRQGGRTAARAAGVRNLDALKGALGLSDAQVQQLRDLRRQQAEASRPALEQMRQNGQAIREAMQADNPDAARVGQLMVDGKKLREATRASREEYHSKAQALLTPEQKAKLAELQQAGRKAGAARQAMGLGLLAPPRPAARRAR